MLKQEIVLVGRAVDALDHVGLDNVLLAVDLEGLDGARAMSLPGALLVLSPAIVETSIQPHIGALLSWRSGGTNVLVERDRDQEVVDAIGGEMLEPLDTIGDNGTIRGEQVLDIL